MWKKPLAFKKCSCDLCQLSAKIRAERPYMNPATLEVVNELWNRMAAAELDLEVIEAKQKGNWPT